VTTSTIGLFAGLLLGLTAAVGGFTGFLIALVLGAIGYVIGGQRDGEFDVVSMLRGRGRG
jgi:outer membrane lipoprotein SlyB